MLMVSSLNENWFWSFLGLLSFGGSGVDADDVESEWELILVCPCTFIGSFVKYFNLWFAWSWLFTKWGMCLVHVKKLPEPPWFLFAVIVTTPMIYLVALSWDSPISGNVMKPKFCLHTFPWTHFLKRRRKAFCWFLNLVVFNGIVMKLFLQSS